MEPRCAIAILAGGESRRFKGIDKQEILLGGRMMGSIVAANALAVSSEVLVVGRNPRPYENMPIRLLPDTLPGFGPLSGLVAALEAARADFVYLLACDMPFFSNRWYSRLLRAASESPSVLAVNAWDGIHIEPFHALYATKLAARARACAEAQGAGARISIASVLQNQARILIPRSEAGDPRFADRLFFNINRSDDLDRAMLDLDFSIDLGL